MKHTHRKKLFLFFYFNHCCNQTETQSHQSLLLSVRFTSNATLVFYDL